MRGLWWRFGAAAVAFVLCVALCRSLVGTSQRDVRNPGTNETSRCKAIGGRLVEASLPTGIAATEPAEPPETEVPLTAEERAEQEEAKLVDAFDALTDRWAEPAKGGVTMMDVEAFVRQFDAVPKDRKEECLQRALNLIPDENVMLLAGVLMDKTQDKELVELVFNDILNRDENVKGPILRQVCLDRTHPCRADAAWILDVTE